MKPDLLVQERVTLQDHIKGVTSSYENRKSKFSAQQRKDITSMLKALTKLYTLSQMTSEEDWLISERATVLKLVNEALKLKCGKTKPEKETFQTKIKEIQVLADILCFKPRLGPAQVVGKILKGIAALILIVPAILFDGILKLGGISLGATARTASLVMNKKSKQNEVGKNLHVIAKTISIRRQPSKKQSEGGVPGAPS
jgi:hypothetical protein